MYCIHNGRVCVMVYDASEKEWVYIPEQEYNRMVKK